MQIIKSQRLQKGDKVGVISPSMHLYDRMESFEKAIPLFAEKLGVEVVVSPHARGRYYYSSGTKQERLDDFHEMLRDDSIKAILFSVGGNTAIDLLDGLDYELIKSHPKIIAGISDATTLLNPIFSKTGLITFHGLEFSMFGRDPMLYTYEQISKTWFDGTFKEVKANPHWKNFDNLPTRYAGWQCLKEGKAEGKLIGGNFSSFLLLRDTRYKTALEGNIFVFESYGWSKRAIHHRLMSMRLSGDFEKISGMIVGYCLGSDNPEELGNERDIKEVLLEVTQGYNFPIMQIGEIGHKVENFLLPIGANATIDAGSLKLVIDEPFVV